MAVDVRVVGFIIAITLPPIGIMMIYVLGELRGIRRDMRDMMRRLKPDD